MEHRVEEVKLGKVRGLLIDIPGSKVIGSEIWFNSGFRFSDESKLEMPHITEHLLVSANKRYPDSMEFKQELEKNGGYYNASTNDLFNSYAWAASDFDAERMLNLAVPQLTQPLISPKDVKTEKSRVREELEGYQSDHFRVSYDSLASRFYRQPTNLERLAQLGTISAQDMRQYYLDSHNLGNGCFFAAGNIKQYKQPLLAKFEDIFGGLPTGEWRVATSRGPKTVDEPIIEERDIAQIHYRIQFAGSVAGFRQWAALSLLTTLMDSYLPSSLYREVWQSGLAYGIQTFYGYDHLETDFGISYRVSPNNFVTLFNVIAKHLRQATARAITHKELAAIKKMSLGQARLRYQTPGSLLGFYIEDYMLFSEHMGIDDWFKLQASITAAEIKRVASELIHGGEWAVSAVGPLSKSDPQKAYDLIKKVVAT